MSEEWVPWVGPVPDAGGRGPLHHLPSPAATADGPPPRSGEDWTKALAAFEAAEAEVGRFEAFAKGRAADEVDEAAREALLGALYASLQALLLAPAPDPAALRRKIALVVDFEAGSLSGAARFMAALKADSERLLGG